MENEQTYFTSIQKATGLATPEEPQLNAAQLEAVTTTEGFVRVIAGAGTGKTRALTHRFAYLVNDLGILPGNILCVTFSNKAANEMRQRIRRVTGDNDTGYIARSIASAFRCCRKIRMQWGTRKAFWCLIMLISMRCCR